MFATLFHLISTIKSNLSRFKQHEYQKSEDFYRSELVPR